MYIGRLFLVKHYLLFTNVIKIQYSLLGRVITGQIDSKDLVAKKSKVGLPTNLHP